MGLEITSVSAQEALYSAESDVRLIGVLVLVIAGTYLHVGGNVFPRSPANDFALEGLRVAICSVVFDIQLIEGNPKDKPYQYVDDTLFHKEKNFCEFRVNS